MRSADTPIRLPVVARRGGNGGDNGSCDGYGETAEVVAGSGDAANERRRHFWRKFHSNDWYDGSVWVSVMANHAYAMMLESEVGLRHDACVRQRRGANPDEMSGANSVDWALECPDENV